MNNPKFLVNIYHNPSTISGQQLINVAGVTQSMPQYSEPYFVATMPEIKIYATGSSYTEALNNLLAIAGTSSTIDPGNGYYNSIRTH